MEIINLKENESALVYWEFLISGERISVDLLGIIILRGNKFINLSIFLQKCQKTSNQRLIYRVITKKMFSEKRKKEATRYRSLLSPSLAGGVLVSNSIKSKMLFFYE